MLSSVLTTILELADDGSSKTNADTNAPGIVGPELYAERLDVQIIDFFSEFHTLSQSMIKV